VLHLPKRRSSHIQARKKEKNATGLQWVAGLGSPGRVRATLPPMGTTKLQAKLNGYTR